MEFTAFILKLLKFPLHFFYTGTKYLDSVSRSLLPYYTDETNLPNVECLDKTIICMFDGKIAHGGLADRLHGMVSLYQYAKSNGFRFKIFHVCPFNLSQFLQPATFDWEIMAGDINYNNKMSRPVFLASSDNLLENRFLERYMSRVFHGFRQYHVYPSIKLAKSEFTELYSELFCPSPMLAEKIKDVMADIGGNYISMSFRFVELLGDFKDSLHKTLDDVHKKLLIEKCLCAIKDVEKLSVKHERVVVTSDSITFLERVKHLSNVYVIPGKLGHVDYQNDIATHLKTFLDFYVIANADEVYMIRTKEMYRSGFAECASLVHGKPFKEYVVS